VNTLNADEVRAKYIAEFGEKDVRIIEHIIEKVANMALRWRVFLYLYGGPQERVDTLYQASGLMAKMLQDLIWDDTLLRIRQMTDPETQGRNQNLSLHHLVRIAGKKETDLSSAYKILETACADAKVFASKKIAHLDLPVVMGSQQFAINRKQTTDAVNAIFCFVNEFKQKLFDRSIHLISHKAPDDETQFLLRLYQGIEAEKVLRPAAVARFMAEDSKNAGVSQGYTRPDIPHWIKEDHKLDRLF
jgi:hypothetical protein